MCLRTIVFTNTTTRARQAMLERVRLELRVGACTQTTGVMTRTNAEVSAMYTMVERPALPPLVLPAYLLPKTSASAITAAAVGVATSSIAAERNSKIISASVTRLARHPFWSALPSRDERIDVS